MEITDRNFVPVSPGMHRTNQANVVNNIGSMRQKLRQLRTTLTTWRELKGTAKQFLASFVYKAEMDVLFVIGAAVLGQLRFRIRQIHVRRTAMLKQRNHGFGARFKMRLARQQIVMGLSHGDAFRAFASGTLLLQHPGECDRADAHCIVRQELSSTGKHHNPSSYVLCIVDCQPACEVSFARGR